MGQGVKEKEHPIVKLIKAKNDKTFFSLLCNEKNFDPIYHTLISHIRFLIKNNLELNAENIFIVNKDRKNRNPVHGSRCCILEAGEILI